MKYKTAIFSEFTEKITTYMTPRPAKDILETAAFIKQAIVGLRNSSNLGLVILKKDSEEFLGCAGLHEIKCKYPELGIWLKQSAHGHKYGLEAIAAIKQWADENLDYEYLRYPVDRANIASRKIPEAFGGKSVREYDQTNMSGKALHIIEYVIDRTTNNK